MTILLTTHYLDEAEQLCDRVAIVHRGPHRRPGQPGRAAGPLGSRARRAARRRRRVDRGVVAARPRASPATTPSPSAPPCTSRVHDRPAHDAAASIAELGLAVTAITSRPPTLDDVYLQLTGEPLAA